MMTITKRTLLFFLLCFSLSLQAEDFNQVEEKKFIDEMVIEHDFDRRVLEKIFKKAKLQKKILEAISRPAEKSKPWYEYRQIFVTPDRIKKGAEFWKKHRNQLIEVEKQYGVPRQIIVAIIGVETYYGKHKGKYRVIDALATLAFNYPKRAIFFRNELKQFLLFTRELKIDPLSLMGSYAGAMGMPQFMPSSFQAYAVDFNKDGRINIWDNEPDIFASIANYFKHHGWQTGEPVAVPTWIKEGANVDRFVKKGIKPSIPLSDLINAGVEPKRKIDGNPLASLLVYQQKNGEDYWVAFQNFYTITRYNHSPLYGMAVYQLSEAVREAYLNDALLK